MPRLGSPKSQIVSKLSNLRPTDVVALSRLSSAETTTTEFGRVFKENPAAALATKGIVISAEEAGKLSRTIEGMAAGRGGEVATEVEVTVKIKF